MLTPLFSDLNQETTQAEILTAVQTLATEATAQALVTLLGTPPQQADVQAITTALGTDALGKDSSLQSILTALGPLATEATLETLGKDATLQQLYSELQQIASNTTPSSGGGSSSSFPSDYANSENQSSALTYLALLQLGAAYLGKAGGSAFAAGDAGISPLGVRSPTTPVARGAVGAYIPPLLDAEGKAVIVGSADPIQSWQAAASFTSTTATALKAAATTRLYLTDLTVSNTGTSAVKVTLQDANTTVVTLWAATIPAGQVVTKDFRTPPRTTSAKALNVVLSATGTVDVSASGYAGI